MHYRENKSKFLKIYVTLPKYVNQLRGMFEKNMVSFNSSYQFFEITTYESNMPYALRFMIDNDIVGMQWIQIQGGKYVLRRESQKTSLCQFEFDVVEFSDVEAVPLDQDSKIAPLRIMSFDIECAAKKGKFPTPD